MKSRPVFSAKLNFLGLIGHRRSVLHGERSKQPRAYDAQHLRPLDCRNELAITQARTQACRQRLEAAVTSRAVPV
jgi:hypothetical protein